MGLVGESGTHRVLKVLTHMGYGRGRKGGPILRHPWDVERLGEYGEQGRGSQANTHFLFVGRTSRTLCFFQSLRKHPAKQFNGSLRHGNPCFASAIQCGAGRGMTMRSGREKMTGPKTEDARTEEQN
ncbi:hypothetical protein NDU88_006056 [Pleurodeles waltl]|uniref:Uncharacterized protein n=1 Tax=Pleurodeles waltl TaxID=8319 RepID=A0AAV7N069_PLEWA|nr:hypothetical protein NDU88_006056 [Pleurodeles waltl]